MITELIMRTYGFRIYAIPLFSKISRKIVFLFIEIFFVSIFFKPPLPLSQCCFRRLKGDILVSQITRHAFIERGGLDRCDADHGHEKKKNESDHQNHPLLVVDAECLVRHCWSH